MKSTTKLIATLLVFIFSFGCTSNDTSSPSGCEECSYSVASNETAGTIPASLNGVHNLTFAYAQPGSPFTDGTTATFTFDNNTVTIEISGSDCITLKNPIQTSASETTFKDTCRNNLSFAFSVTQSGSLNEVNVMSTSNNWFGQFTN